MITDPDEIAERLLERAAKVRCPFCFHFARFCSCRRVHAPGAIDASSTDGDITDDETDDDCGWLEWDERDGARPEASQLNRAAVPGVHQV